MSYYLAPIANEQQVDANGAPVSGGKIWTYIAGTTTPATTYTDDTGATPQANPIVLNSLGVPGSPVWLEGGRSYKFVFTDANDVQTRPTVDDVTGINDAGLPTTDQWVIYAGAPTYISATSFSVVGDQRTTFQVARRVKTSNTGGTIYSTISASAFGSGVTTVTVTNDAGTLDSGLSSVHYGLISATSSSLPTNITAAQLATGRTISLTGDVTATTAAFDGSGNVSGAATIAANAVTTAKIANANITAAKLDGAQSGSAPIYGARAWVNFNGTGTVAIRASGNVSSITDNGTGDYTVNFTTAMADVNFAAVASATASGVSRLTAGAITYLTTSVRIDVNQPTVGNVDPTMCNVIVAR